MQYTRPPATVTGSSRRPGHSRTSRARPWWLIVRAYLADTPIEDLAGLAAHTGCRTSSDRLYCPRCQPTATAQLLDGGAARVDAAAQTWLCERCRAAGDRLDLERLVMSDPLACRAVLARIAGSA